MDFTCISDLNVVISRVRKLQSLPPRSPSVCIYTITPERTGISAVDVNQQNLSVAFSCGHSHDICVTQKEDSEIHSSGNLVDAWARYKAARNEESSKTGMAEDSPVSSLLYTFPHGAVNVTGLQFTVDGNILLSCGLDGTVKAWSTSSFQLLESYHGTSRLSSDIHASFDCKHFATSFRLGGQLERCLSNAALYSFEKKHPVLTFRGHVGDTECVRFHPNGLYIATASCDRTIKLWCTRSGKGLRNFQVSDCHDYPMKLAFSPDGKYLASAYYESIKIWDLASGKMLKHLEIPNSMPGVMNLCYSKSGDVLAAGGSNKKLHFWNTKSNSSESFDINAEYELLKCDSIGKTVYCIKNTSSFFTCAVA